MMGKNTKDRWDKDKYNKGQDDDMRAHKLDELKRHVHDAHPSHQYLVEGFEEVDWKCVVCGEVNRAPKETQAGSWDVYCRTCKTVTLQERIYDSTA